MKTYKSLVKFALAKNCVVSVWDGEEYPVQRSSAYKAIIEAIESVEMAELIIRDAEGAKVAWAMIIPFGVEDDETVADNTITPFMEEFDSMMKLQTMSTIFTIRS